MKVISSDLLDYFQEKELSAYVHSIFCNTINIQTDDKLISILNNEEDIVPMSISLEQEDFSKLKIKRGDELKISNETISFKDFEIDLDTFLIWNSEVEVLSRDIYNLENKMFLIGESISEYGNKNGLASLCTESDSNLYTEYIEEEFYKFLTTITYCDFKNINKRASKLIGYGPGLTPSMDDLLSGLMISLIYYSKCYNFHVKKIEKINFEIIKNLQNKTSTISTEMLKNSSVGKCSYYTKRLLLDILNDESDFDYNVRKVISRGSSSGTDLLVGIYFGLSIMLNSDFRRGIKNECLF